MANDILNDSEYYDMLQNEFNQFCKARGPLKLHGTKYLTMVLIDVTARIKVLELMPDDDYQSRAAALLHWKDYRARVVTTLRDKR